MTEFPEREKLLKKAKLPPDINSILWSNFEFQYHQDTTKKSTLSGIITGVRHSESGDDNLILYPMYIFIGKNQVHGFCFTGESNKWKAILIPALEDDYKEKWWPSIMGTFELVG